MDWEDLRHFLTLAQTGSLSEAARRLKVDHTTVARRVAALETALGLRLVDRLPRAYALTEEGQRIAQLGVQLEDNAFAILRAARAVDPAPMGVVRISAPPVFASVFLAPRLAALRKSHPGIVIELIGDSRAADLDRREADMALRLIKPANGGLISRKLGVLGYGLYGAQQGSEQVFLAYDESLDHVPQQRWLYAIAGDRPIVFRANDAASLAAAARSGMGVAVLPNFLAEHDPDLVSLPLPDNAPSPPGRELWLVVHDDLRRSPRIRIVMDFIIEATREALGC